MNDPLNDEHRPDYLKVRLNAAEWQVVKDMARAKGIPLAAAVRDLIHAAVTHPIN
jgi:hypothetical protein